MSWPEIVEPVALVGSVATAVVISASDSSIVPTTTVAQFGFVAAAFSGAYALVKWLDARDRRNAEPEVRRAEQAEAELRAAHDAALDEKQRQIDDLRKQNRTLRRGLEECLGRRDPTGNEDP